MGSEQLERAKKHLFIALVVDLALGLSINANALVISGKFMAISGGSPIADDAFIASLHTHDDLVRLSIVTTCGIGYLLLRWLNECYKFARESIGASGFERDTGIVWGWLLPFYNLFRPYQTINELYKLGSNHYSRTQGWKALAGSFALLSWWIYYTIAHLLMISMFQSIRRLSGLESASIKQVINMYELEAGVFGISVSIVILWIVVAKYLTKRLIEKANTSPITEEGNARLVEETVSSASAISAHGVGKAPTTRPSEKKCEAVIEISEAATSRLTIPIPAMPESDDWAFEKVADELETSTTDKVLWTRVFAESGGEESKAKALYIQRRVVVLLEAERKRLAEEEHARAVETQRQQDLQDELERIRALETRREEEKAEALANAEREKIEAAEKVRQVEDEARRRHEQQKAKLDNLEKTTTLLNPPNQGMSVGTMFGVTVGIAGVLVVAIVISVTPDSPSNAIAPVTLSTPAVPSGPDYRKMEVAELKAKAATDANAAYQVMVRYELGSGGVSSDHTQAFYWGEIAANQGHAQAQAMIGWYYTSGRGIPEDKQKGLVWLEKSAAQNNPMGLSNLGWRYQIGEGVPKDYQKAFEYAKRASDLGNQVGRNNLAELYEKGNGIPKDYAKALELFEPVATTGISIDSILGMIRIYADQSGNYNYPVLAYAWLRIALDKPYDKEELQPHTNELMALKQLLEERLSPAQIEIARIKAANWKKGDYLRP